MIIQAGWLKSLFSHLGKERGFHLNQLEKLSHFVPSLIVNVFSIHYFTIISLWQE